MLVSYLAIASIFTSASWAEFQVNTHKTDNQTNTAIAMDLDGNFVVVWSSYDQDGDKGGIFGQLFDPNCEPVGNEFQINTTEMGHQTEPSVAMNDGGDFVAAWQGHELNNEDIYAQRFDANGILVDVEFRVNDNTNGRQLHPKVAMSNTGAFVIVWECLDMPEPGKRAIRGQLYDHSGSEIGDELPISDTPSVCRHPDVAMNNSNEVIVVWTGVSTFNYIYVRHFEADGNEPSLNSKKVDDEKFSTLTRPSLAIDGMDNYVVAWDGRCTDSNSDNIYIKRYHWSHAHLHDEQFLVNTQQAGDQTNPSVAMSDDSFVVVWESDAESENNQRNIFGQRFVNQGEDIGYPIPLGDEFQINTYVVDDQKYPDVAIRENGEFVTVWQSDVQDGSDYGIFGEFGPKICCADFSDNGFVNFRDYCVLAEEWLKNENPLKADLFDDNIIDEQDLGAFCKQWLTPCYDCNEVDINSDGKIDFEDYALWAANWLQQGPNLDGDITGNGIVDIADLKALLFHWTEYCE